MSIIAVVISLMVVVWLIQTFIPMDARVKQLIHVFVIICIVLWLLQVFGVFHLLQAPVPRVD